MKTHIAWRSLCHNRRQAISVFLLSACAAALLLASSFLGSGIRSGLVSAVMPFDLLVGTGGSYQMVVNTVFLQDYPTSNVPYRLVEELRADKRVASAIPLGFGDNYRGYRIVGTEPELFTLPTSPDDKRPWLRLSRGELFSSSRQAVAGARVARELGLQIGDELVTTHGFIENSRAESHEALVLTGILEQCDGPYDQAIFVSLSSIWEAHEHHGDEEHSDEEHGEEEHGDEEAHDDGHDEEEHDEEHGEDTRQTTTIMVKPAGYAEAYSLYSDFQKNPDAEMVFPSQVVIRLLSILGQSEWVFKAVGAAAGILATAIVFLVLFWSACSRADEMRILGLLGASKRERLLMVLLEGMFAVIPGVLSGCVAGTALLSMLGDVIAQRSGLVIAAGMSLADLGLIAALVASGLLGGVFGGWRSMREE